MRTLLVASFVVWVGMMAAPLLAQSAVPFWQFPALWSASENVVIKRGADQDGTPNANIYIRKGWGSCIRVSRREVKDAMLYLDTDQYVNLRDFAAARLEDGEWTDEDRFNCPPPPLEVKPTWRGSRPVYAMEWDYTNHTGTRMGKTRYRAIDGACLRYNARSNGELTNYWMLDPATTVYLDDAPVLVSNIEGHVAAICGDAEVDITEWSQ